MSDTGICEMNLLHARYMQMLFVCHRKTGKRNPSRVGRERVREREQTRDNVKVFYTIVSLQTCSWLMRSILIIDSWTHCEWPEQGEGSSVRSFLLFSPLLFFLLPSPAQLDTGWCLCTQWQEKFATYFASIDLIGSVRSQVSLSLSLSPSSFLATAAHTDDNAFLSIANAFVAPQWKSKSHGQL